MGDVYVFCLYLKANLHLVENGRCVIVLTKKILCRIFDLFELQNCFLCTEKNAADLTLFSLVAPHGINIKNITPFSRFNHTDISFRFGGVFFTMAEIYKYHMFRLPKDAGIQYPVFHPDESVIENLFAENKLVNGKTVILVPAAGTAVGFSKEFWRKLAETLWGKGYIVCTNVAGNESPVAGTVPLSFEIHNGEELLKRAGLFIALRNGICDVFCNADCLKIILYSKYRIFNSSLYDFCSFEKMGIGRNIIEIQESIEREEELLDVVLGHVPAVLQEGTIYDTRQSDLRPK
jgi:hypothetical protein